MVVGKYCHSLPHMIEKRQCQSYYYSYVGQSGLGKSTLVNTIFASHLIESKGRLNADEPPRQTTEIETVSHRTLPFYCFFLIFCFS